MADDTTHSGGNTYYWQDDVVEKYEYQQQLVSEQKAERLSLIVRMIRYFCSRDSISSPFILDIGCGPGTATTLSKYILEGIPESSVIGVDSSEQMLEVAVSRLCAEYGDRFTGYISDFNSPDFWKPGINRKFDFIVSFASMHYLSDKRIIPFLREIYEHIADDGVFIAAIGNHSEGRRIAEMEHLFRIEFGYNQLDESRRPPDFQGFKARHEEADKKANINWQNPENWLKSIRSAGFKEADIVFHLLITSIFIALK
ncbi:class I SAM-dependent methyltransferase [Chloroflexota bacterium]